jgi:Mg-chelatase subunit ChlI
MLNERDVAVKALELELEMEELLKLEKNEFCNRIFKCKLKKLLAPISGYYELVYQQWKKEVEKTRKKRVVKHNRSDRDYNSQQKSEYKEAGKQQYRKYKKNRKSNSLESNETNETENSKDCEKKQEPKNNQQLQENCSENYNEEFE